MSASIRRPARSPLSSASQRNLLRSLLEYDGRDTKYLQSLADEYSDTVFYCDELIAASSDSENHVSDGASWLLLAHLRAGGELNVDQVSKLISNLNM